MKKFSVPACAALALSLVMAVGSVSFLGPCVHDDGSFGACHWAGQAMLAIGAVLACQSLLALIVCDTKKRQGVFLSMIPTAAVALLIPGTLIDLCRMASMRCRAVMQPAMIILSALVLALALAGWLLSRKQAR